MAAIRVFLADDHELVRYGLRALLDAEADIEIAGEAGDTDGVISGCVACEPDVLLLDLHMPGEGGVEACRRVRELLPETSVLVLTSFDENDELFGAVAAGAAGYLLKDTRPELLAGAIRAVAAGDPVFDPTISGRISAGRPPSKAEELDLRRLSERETEVLELMAKGMSNKEIGRTLWIGETTVKTHVSHILRKLGQSDRTQAVITAVKANLVRLED